MMLRGFTNLLFILYAVQGAKPQYKGKYGPVSGCKCLGGGKDGDCGFHISAGKDDEPWCRTEYGCGYPATLFRGSWNYCNKGAVERRRAGDGKLYSSYEFYKYYRDESKAKWTLAKNNIEKRYDRDDKLYSIHDFRAFYVDIEGEKGWLTKWESLSDYPEKRKGPNGKWLTFDEMWQKYGKDDVWNQWVPKNITMEEM